MKKKIFVKTASNRLSFCLTKPIPSLAFLPEGLLRESRSPSRSSRPRVFVLLSGRRLSSAATPAWDANGGEAEAEATRALPPELVGQE